MLSFLELSPEFDLTWWEWALACLGGIVCGLSKGGIKGVGIFSVTLIAFVFGGKASTGIVLPLFMLADIFAVKYYTRHTQWKYLRQLLPWMIAGVLFGVWVGKDLPELFFKRGMAIIIIGTVFMMWFWDRKRDTMKIPDNQWFGGIMGVGAGFTTMIGNLAGAFANIFFLAMRLPKNQFIGTAAWLFFIINIFKFPFHIFVWETITVETLILDLRLIPGVLLGFFLGIRIVKKINETVFRKLILILTAIGAIMIFFK